MSSDQTIVSYQNTYGATPWLFAKFLNNPAHLTVPNVIFMVAAWSLGGIPLGIFAFFVGVNDIFYASGKRKVAEPNDVVVFESQSGWRLTGSSPLALPEASPVDVDAEEMPLESTGATTLTTPAERLPAADPASVTTATIPRPVDAQITEPSPWASPVDHVNASIQTPIVATEPTQDERSELLNSFRRSQSQEVLSGPARELLRKEDGYLRSWLCMVPTGGGKGITEAYASIQAMRLYPGVSLWAVDPKSDPSEYKRWCHIPESHRYHYNAMQPSFEASDEARIIEGIKGILHGYAEDPAPLKILIIDELPAILRSLKKYGRKALEYFHSIASMGRSSGSVVWLFSNSIGLKSNGITSQERSYYHTLYAASPQKLAPITGYKEFPGPCIEKTDPVFNETGRAFWASTLDAWEPVPSSYNDVIEALPTVDPPKGFGRGDFQGAAVAVAINELATELADMPAGKLSELLPKTSVGDNPAISIDGIAKGLRSCPEILKVRKVKDDYWVQAAEREDTETISFAFL